MTLRQLAVRLLVVGGGLTLLPGVASSQVAAPITTQRSIGGVQVVHRYVPGSRTIVAALYLRGGVALVTDSTQGLEPLLLEANSAATPAYPGTSATKLLALTGTTLSTDADRDYTAIELRGLAEDFGRTWPVLLDQVMNRVPDDSTLLTARAARITRARLRNEDAGRRARRHACGILFADHPYRFEPSGTDQSMQTITKADLVDFHDRMMVASRMLLVVVGDIAPAALDSVVGPGLRAVPPGAFTMPILPEPHAPTNRWQIEPRATPNSYIAGCYVGPPRGSPEETALQFATLGLSSLLNSAIRNERSLSYAAYADLDSGRQSVGSIAVSTSKPEQVWPLIRAQLARVIGFDISSYWIKSVVRIQRSRAVLAASTSTAQVGLLAEAAMYGEDIQRAGTVAAVVEPAQFAVTRAAATYWQSLQFGFVGDTTGMSGKW